MDAVVNHLKDLKNEGIDYVLTGSLRLFKGTMRVNIQLMTVDNGNIFWSESFLRHQITEENAFDVQDEIISQIVNVIADDPKMMNTLNKRRHSANSRENPVQDAIDLYFDYAYDYNSNKFETTLLAVEKAYKVAEDNVLIVSILAKLYLDVFACAATHNEAILQKGIELANKAVSLDPRSQFAQKALAFGMVLAGEKHRAERAISQCVVINPTAATSLGTLGLSLIMMSEYERGYELLKRSLKLQQNPAACAKLGLSLYHYHKKNYKESSKWLDLLPPFDIPFCRLLNIALDGHLNGKTVHTDASFPEIIGQEIDIVGRIVHDPKLRTGIVDGWKRAGFVA
jgi:tetratricopeptide (TPR) repeat protein